MRIGHGDPRFVGYSGATSGPRELYDAIVADAHCNTAIIDGVLVNDWRDESDLEVDDQGNALKIAGKYQKMAKQHMAKHTKIMGTMDEQQKELERIQFLYEQAP